MSLLDQATLDWIREGEAETPLSVRAKVLTDAWTDLLGVGRGA